MTRTATALLTLTAAASAFGFNPQQGDWGKDDPAHLRVMTWNVEDGICSTATKTEGFNSWTALARVVAAMKPDVLILQETADNSANSDQLGGSIDPADRLTEVLEVFMHGGPDPWRGGTATAFVQAYDPGFDLPFIYSSETDDGFNRNALLSRYPIADINGDGSVQGPSIFNLADAYAPGGGSGIRGFQFAEIDLPDEVYAGDLVIGNSHLKAFGDSDSRQERIEAAQNIVYFLNYFYNGAGTGMCDPNGRIFVPGSNDGLLGPDDVVVWGGDWNEDEATNGRKGPAEWMVRAQITGGTADGPDADGTDATYDSAFEPFSGSTDTRGGSKLDYLAWFDSVGTAVNQVVLEATQIPIAQMPPEMAGFVVPTLLTSQASDHMPVFIDLELPAAETPECPADLDGMGSVDSGDLGVLLAAWGATGVPSDLDGSGTVESGDLGVLLAAWGPCP